MIVAALALSLIMLAGPAVADPGTLVVALLGGTATLGTIGAAAVQIGVGLAASALAQRLRSRRMRTRATGIETQVTTQGGTLPQTMILGTYATGGNIVAPFYAHGSAGKIDNAYRTQIIDLADVPIEAVTAVWVDDQRFAMAELTGPAHPAYGLTPAASGERKKYSARFWIRVLDGRQSTADADLVARQAGHPLRPWTADHIGRGVAHAILTFRYDANVWRGEPQVRFEVQGARLYDWRADSTAGGSGPQREADAATWAWTDNPIVMTRAILRGVPLADGGIWGLGVPAADLPADWWTTAADRCDQIVGGARRYRAGYEVRLATPEQGGDTPFDVIDALLDACAGEIADIGGTWIVHVAESDLPVAAFGDDDLLVDLTDDLDPFPPLTDRFNAVRASYVSPAAGWQAKEAPPRYDSAAAARDGRVLVADLSLPAVFDDRQVQSLMQAWLAEAQRHRRRVVTLPPEYGRLLPFDVITETSARNGFDAKAFRVLSVATDPLTLNVTLGLREVDPADYDWAAEHLLPSPPAAIEVVAPAPLAVPGWAVAPVTVTNAAATIARAGIAISWASDLDGVEEVIWQVRLAASAAAVTEGSTGDVGFGRKAILDGIIGQTDYQVRGRLSVPGRVTDWTDWTAVTTDAAHIGLAELSPAIVDDLDDLHAWIDGGITDLPGEISAINTAMLARIAEAEAAAARWRDLRDQAAALQAEVVELASASHAAREAIRAGITVRLEDLRASYDEQIVVLADTDLAAALRLTTLEAGSDDLAARITETQAAIIEGDEALALLIATLSVGSAVAFDHAAIWYFDSAVEGWTGAPSAPSVVAGWLRPGGDSFVASPSGLAVAGGAYAQVRLRARKVGTPTWTGHLWWAGPSEAWHSGRRVTISEPAWEDGIAAITFNPTWSGEIDRIRVELTDDADGSNYVEIDWVAVGRPAPGASSAEIVAERQARISGDDALAFDLVSVTARLDDAETDISGQAAAISGLDSRVGANETGLIAAAGRLDDVEAEIVDPVTGLDALSGAIDSLSALVNSGVNGAQVAQAEAIRTLRSAISSLGAEGIEAGARESAATRDVRAYVAQASQALSTRVDLTDAQVLIVAQAVTLLQAAIPGLATADALSALTATVTTQGSTVTAITDALVKLGATVGPSTAETVFRMTAEATPSGALARIGLKAVATGTEGDARAAALFLDALSGDQSRVVVQGDRFFVLIGTSNIPLFVIEAGAIRLNAALIKLTGDVEVDGTFQIASGASGARRVITAQRTVTYDASGAVVMVEGDLTGYV